MAKVMGFTIQELGDMSIGQVLDQVVEYVKAHDAESKPRSRKATQADMDCF